MSRQQGGRACRAAGRADEWGQGGARESRRTRRATGRHKQTRPKGTTRHRQNTRRHSSGSARGCQLHAGATTMHKDVVGGAAAHERNGKRAYRTRAEGSTQRRTVEDSTGQCITAALVAATAEDTAGTAAPHTLAPVGGARRIDPSLGEWLRGGAGPPPATSVRSMPVQWHGGGAGRGTTWGRCQRRQLRQLGRVGGGRHSTARCSNHHHGHPHHNPYRRQPRIIAVTARLVAPPPTRRSGQRRLSFDRWRRRVVPARLARWRGGRGGASTNSSSGWRRRWRRQRQQRRRRRSRRVPAMMVVGSGR